MIALTRYLYPANFQHYLDDNEYYSKADPFDMAMIADFLHTKHSDYDYFKGTSFREVALRFLSISTKKQLDSFIENYGELCEESSDFNSNKHSTAVFQSKIYISPEILVDIYKHTYWLSQAVKQDNRLECIRHILPLYYNQYTYLNDERLTLTFNFYAKQGEVEQNIINEIEQEYFALREQYSHLDIRGIPLIEVIPDGKDVNTVRLYINDKRVIEYANYALRKIIERHLEDINTEIEWNEEKKRFGTLCVSKSLLACLYMEMVSMITEEAYVRKCANKTCNQYFEIQGNDMRKIYCNNSCSLAVAKRMQRARDKARKEI